MPAPSLGVSLGIAKPAAVAETVAVRVRRARELLHLSPDPEREELGTRCGSVLRIR
jgi:hypothetical protein